MQPFLRFYLQILNIFKENNSRHRYRFKAKGKEYSGICLKCKTEEEAYQYMQKIKNEICDREKGIIACKIEIIHLEKQQGHI